MTNDLKNACAPPLSPETTASVGERLMSAAPGQSSSGSPLPDGQDLLHVARLVTIGEVAACVAHDLMQPLQTIRGHITMLNEALPPGDPIRAPLAAISKAEHRITDLGRRLLAYSRKREVHLGNCDIGEIVDDAIRFSEPYLTDRNVQVEVIIQENIPPLHVDRWQIVQAIVNLVQNAVDAMAECSFRFLSVSVRRESDDVRIAVTDTGHGIPKEDLPKIFMPFFTTKGEHGTGLGLFILRRVVDSHHGGITVQSTASGTTFVVSLPLHKADADVSSCECSAMSAGEREN